MVLLLMLMSYFRIVYYVFFSTVLGMTKEVSNLIKENNELLETKYARTLS